MNNHSAQALALMLCLSNLEATSLDFIADDRFAHDVRTWVDRISANSHEKKAATMAWIASRIVDMEVAWIARG